MSNKHLSRDPKHPDNESWIWYYEDPGGLEVFVNAYTVCRDTNSNILRVTIPWRSIRASLRRKDKVDD